MNKKRSVLGVLLAVVIILIAAGISLFTPVDAFGLDFTDKVIIKADIKETFSEDDIYSILGEYKDKLGDVSVAKSGDEYLSVVISAQHGDEELAKEIVEKITAKYSGAAYRGFFTEVNYRGKAPLVTYSMIVALAVLLVSVYLAARQGIASGVAAFISGGLGIACAVCLGVVAGVPINIASYMGSVMSALLSGVAVSFVLNSKIFEEFKKSDIDISDKNALCAIRKPVAVKGLIVAAAPVAFVGIMVALGGISIQGFGVAVAFGFISGVLGSLYIGAPLMWQFMANNRLVKTKPAKKVKAIK